MSDDYIPEKETVEEYIHRHLREGMEREADAYFESVVHGDNSGGPLQGILSKSSEEARCSEETAMKLKDHILDGPVQRTPFAVALGIPLVVSADVPVGKFQFWQDGKLIREVEIEL